MTIEAIIEICKAYDAMGGAVQEQLIEVLDNSETMGDQNPNALRMINRDFLNVVRECANNEDDQELLTEVNDLIEQILEATR